MRKVRITGEVSAGDPLGHFGRESRSLGSYLAKAEGTDLPVSDPFGGDHVVSLDPFVDLDPRLYFVVRFIVSRDDEPFDRDYSGAVVLKEYELPAHVRLPS